MTTPGQPGGLQYRVTGVTAGQYGTDAAGNDVPGRIVSFSLSNGLTSQVFIPESQYGDYATVQAMVQQAAQHAASVHAITGTLD